MKKTSLFMLFLTMGQMAFAQKTADIYSSTISEEDLKKHLTYIASDELQGRDTGSEGQKKAAKYIADHFQKLGLQAIVPLKNGQKSYFQTFNLYKKGWKEVYIKINNKKKVFFKDFYPNGIINIPQEKNLEIVFAGYGIQNDSRNDFKGLDLKDKAVIFFEGEPKDKDGNFLYSKSKDSEWSGTNGIKKKVKLASDLGAGYFFEISDADAEKFKTLTAERKAVLSRFNRMVFEKTPNDVETKNATFTISSEMAAEILDLKPAKLAALKMGTGKAKSPKKTTITLKSERGDEIVETSNVLGFMEGTDLKDEVVVITAHYDHVGVDAKGEIYNGADDDGSGTCAVLELAEAYAKAKAEGKGPRRSILFMTVTGEEKGLLGSQYYTDVDPVIPLKNTVCDLNIDMIGRIDKAHENNPNYVYLIGSDKLSSELHAISEKANAETVKFDLDYTYNDPKDPNRFYYRSDHYNFAKKGIPVLFYFTGVHVDYHKPGDDVEKILFKKYSEIVKLVFYTSWDLVNRDKRIVVDSNKP
ncbi:M28 family peptidase [Emticicia sp. CRIBPO]|uniref:M28 family peptidase n=1 Tax=Emticicia sp. CRIBPO TaxID=2683258 RepID=UPI001412318F|nr:M28 family peptidase [Emticicia sp. CRIBPO]NBA88231.1 M28 family peptidase [Emticicia sp. CRIBPO]